MKEKIDFIYLSKFQFNDILNTGENIKGQAILTKKYFFILPDKITDAIGMSKRDNYNPEYFLRAKNNFSLIDPIEFDSEMISSLPEYFVIPWSNFEKFEVNVGFFIFGGLKMKKKGLRITSAYIGNTKSRKEVKEFYNSLSN